MADMAGCKIPSWMCSYQAYLSVAYFKLGFLLQITMSMDRYLAVVRPLRYHRLSSLKLMRAVVLMLVFVSLACTAFTIIAEAGEVASLRLWSSCMHLWTFEDWADYTDLGINSAIFLLGLLAFVVCNCSLVRILWQYHTRRADSILRELTSAVQALDAKRVKNSSTPINGERRCASKDAAIHVTIDSTPMNGERDAAKAANGVYVKKSASFVAHVTSAPALRRTRSLNQITDVSHPSIRRSNSVTSVVSCRSTSSKISHQRRIKYWKHVEQRRNAKHNDVTPTKESPSTDGSSQFVQFQQHLQKFIKKVQRKAKKQRREILLSKLVLVCASFFVASWLPYLVSFSSCSNFLNMFLYSVF
jgi:hypothetical protein